MKNLNANPRVAPRTIQFLDAVEIKEIPSIDAKSRQTERRESWNPILNENDIIKTKPTKQRNVIIGFVICGVFLLLLVVGIILGLILGQKSTTPANNSLTYNEVCTVGSNQCMSSQGLYCPNGFCSCTSPYSWNTGTKTCTLLTYNQACSTSSQCNSSLGLNCTNQLCLCDLYHQWSSANNTCIVTLNNTLTYGTRCANGSYQCNSTSELVCAGNCSCRATKFWNISSCVCPSGTFLNSSNYCQPLLHYNRSCVVGSNQCDYTRGLSCNNSLCQCDPTKYWNINFETCLPRVNYSYACTYDSDCVPTLICPTVPGVCNCSQFLPDYVCNCPNTTYYDPTILQCVNRSTYNGTCTTSANYMCQSTLYCNSGRCNCPTGTNWISANSTCS